MSTRRKQSSSRPKPPATSVTAPRATVPADRQPETGSIGQVGRRPSPPLVPLLSGTMWIIVGIAMFVVLTAGWRFIVGGVCIGVGLLFVRGGLVAIVRRSR